jgi:hypothetical protein
VTPTKQTKKYFRPGWNEDFNNRDKAMLQAWIEKKLKQ